MAGQVRDFVELLHGNPVLALLCCGLGSRPALPELVDIVDGFEDAGKDAGRDCGQEDPGNQFLRVFLRVEVAKRHELVEVRRDYEFVHTLHEVVCSFLERRSQIDRDPVED